MDQAAGGKKMTRCSPFVSELLNRLEDLESRCEKQERTIDQMQSRILEQEKHIEDLNKHFEDILKECESFADFMPIFDEKTRHCSERVKAVESELKKIRPDNSKDLSRIVEDQTSRLTGLETSISDLLKFKDVTKNFISNFLHPEPRLEGAEAVPAEINNFTMIYPSEPPGYFYPHLSYPVQGSYPVYYPVYSPHPAPAAPVAPAAPIAPTAPHYTIRIPPDFQLCWLYTLPSPVQPLPTTEN